MEFNWESGQFERAIPTPSPTATVKVTVLNDIHAKYGFISRGKCQADVTAVTDTGCQTTTAGLDICQALGIEVPQNILVPTRHKVVGITNTPLDGVGAIFAKIEINSKATKQMIHILRNSSGLFLSEIALNDLEPHKVHTPIEVPHHWKKKVKANLDRDVRLGIIEPVPQGTPTTWCSRMVVASKKSGEPRRTVDLQKLNDATLRETHHTTTPFNIVSVIPRKTYRTTRH